MAAPLRIGIVAGEASGDLLGSHLIATMHEYRPDLEFVGIGGPRMQAAGMQVWFPMEKLAVRGYVEVLRHYLEIVSIRRRLRDRFIAQPPVIFIGIDAPDFNLDLEIALKSHGIATVHYVSPSIWAWRGERIHKIKRAVDKMLVLFPFEATLYEKAGVPVAYVGHPLADVLPEAPDRAAARRQLQLPEQATVIALLPGSRQSEVEQLAGLFAQAARLVARRISSVHFVAPLVSDETIALFERARVAYAPELAITVLRGEAYAAMTAADIVLVASGTATLEAALLKRPMVITYKMPAVSAWLIRRTQSLPYVGLPNILSNEFVVPELIQEAATPANLSHALVELLSDAASRRRIEDKFRALHRVLKQNTTQKAAEAILPMLSSAGERAA